MPRGVKKGTKRGPYKRTSIGAKKRIKEAAEKGEDWQDVAVKNGVAIPSARNWVLAEDLKPKQRGGGKAKKLEAIHLQSLLEWLEEDCRLRLWQLKDKLRDKYEVNVSTSTIGNELQGQLFTVKQIGYQPHSMNSPENKAKRAAYVTKLLEFQGQMKTLVFIDESNINLYLTRRFGRSKIGEKPQAKIPNSKGPNVHMIGAICSQGLVYSEVKRGSFTKTEFCEWMKRMLLHMRDDNGYNLSQVVCIIDNAPAHSTIEDMKTQDDFAGVEFLRLAPYSAPLNPIEMMWSQMKAQIRIMQAERYEELMQTPEGLTQGEHRLRMVENAAKDAFKQVVPAHCNNYINHVVSHYTPCINLQDLPI